MPGPSYAMPLVVGEKLFVTSEPNDLLCLDKRSGRPIWMHSDTLWHAAMDRRAALLPAFDVCGSLRANTDFDIERSTRSGWRNLD